MSITFDKAAKAMHGMQIASHKDSVGDTVRFAVELAKLPDGTNDRSTMRADAAGKQLKVVVQNSNYNKLETTPRYSVRRSDYAQQDYCILPGDGDRR